jgi:hypothetical protein
VQELFIMSSSYRIRKYESGYEKRKKKKRFNNLCRPTRVLLIDLLLKNIKH